MNYVAGCGVWGGRQDVTHHKNDLGQAEPHIVATMALLWPAGFSKFGLDLLKMTPDICGTDCASSIMLISCCPLEISQKAVHAGFHYKDACLTS